MSKVIKVDEEFSFIRFVYFYNTSRAKEEEKYTHIEYVFMYIM